MPPGNFRITLELSLSLSPLQPENWAALNKTKQLLGLILTFAGKCLIFLTFSGFKITWV
jgi:hypothetical protein